IFGKSTNYLIIGIQIGLTPNKRILRTYTQQNCTAAIEKPIFITEGNKSDWFIEENIMHITLRRLIFPTIIFLAFAAPCFSQSATKNGFTVVKPSADSKLIYVSSSRGNNKNSCLTEAAPCKTIGAGLEKMRKGYPDHLYLKRGDIWRGERMVNNLPSGRSASEPAVLTFYGTSGP